MKKYYYKLEITECMLCGKENSYRIRVFEKPKSYINHEMKWCGCL